MALTLVMFPQVTLSDLLAEVQGLDVSRFLEQVSPLVRHVTDVPSSASVRLMRGLLEVPLHSGVTFSEWLQPYRDAGVDPEWCRVVSALRVRGRADSSSLAHPEAVGTAAYTTRGEGESALVVPASAFGRRRELLRPEARTLGLQLACTPGPSYLGSVPPRPAVPAPVSQIDELAERVAERVALTVGGEAFLRPDRRGRALAVLAASVAAVVSHKSGQRWHRGRRVVRSDVLENIFESLGLHPLFEAGRRVLEADHPDHLPVRGPWPPGDGTIEKSLGILEYNKDEMLALREDALLATLSEPGFVPPDEDAEDVDALD